MRKKEAEQAAATPVAPADAGAAPSASPPAAVAAPAPQAGRASLAGAVSPNGYAPSLVVHHDRGDAISEEYRSLCTHLLTQHADERFCVLITSALPGEGKTVTCLNLAFVLAERKERRTVVVDCDLRKQQVANLLSIENEPGLADVLRGTARIDDVVQPTPYPNLFVVPAGSARVNEVGELLTKPDLEEAAAALRRKYDFVLIDTPPVTVEHKHGHAYYPSGRGATVCSDTGMLGRAVGEAILVVRMYRTPRESVDRAMALLRAANIKPVGLVLTHRKFIIPRALYYRS